MSADYTISNVVHKLSNYYNFLILLRIRTPDVNKVHILNKDITDVRIVNMVIWINNMIIVNKLGLFKHF